MLISSQKMLSSVESMGTEMKRAGGLITQAAAVSPLSTSPPEEPGKPDLEAIPQRSPVPLLDSRFSLLRVVCGPDGSMIDVVRTVRI
jgi:hypothetical protein